MGRGSEFREPARQTIKGHDLDDHLKPVAGGPNCERLQPAISQSLSRRQCLVQLIVGNVGGRVYR